MMEVVKKYYKPRRASGGLLENPQIERPLIG